MDKTLPSQGSDSSRDGRHSGINPPEVAAGVGLKPVHYDQIVTDWPRMGFFEVHAENYMGDGGPPHRYLEAIRAHYPLSIHGVGLNLGGTDVLSVDHLGRLRQLIDRYQPALFSEHLAWTSTAGAFLGDLLPIPYTRDSLRHVCQRIERTQDFLKTSLLLENPATYLRYKESDLPETEFLAEITRRTGCGLLLDVNNVFVSAANHGFDAFGYLNALPADAVGEMHLAGCFATVDTAVRPYFIDAHDSRVREEVWRLYRFALHRFGAVPTLIEWDNNVPDWATLAGEAAKARDLMRDVGTAEARKGTALVSA